MLDYLLANRKAHFGFSVLALALAFGLSTGSILATVGTHKVEYLALLPVGFIYFMGSLFGILALADDNPSVRKQKTFFSIEMAACLFGTLLLPLVLYFLKNA